ncbi:MAG: UvrD-helicase domain-containing protein [Planctomycetaceae bacterium]|nr:UvrD-helicase domain-containing protein [Planctomycetaceae bacterium]
MAQKPATPPPRLVIRASAGTGKTYQLSTRYIAQLPAAAPDRILATTFTRKAAGEILERILLRLADAALDDLPRALLAKSLGRNLSRPQCLDMLGMLVGNLHRVRVSTLDSFFSRVAGSFALELGLPAGWRMLDQIEDEELRSRAIEAVLQQGERRDLLQLMHLLSKGESTQSVTGLVRDTVKDLYAVFQETSAEAWRSIDGPAPLSQEDLEQAIDDLRNAPLPLASWTTPREKELAALADGDWEEFIAKGIANKVLDDSADYNRRPIPDDLRNIYRRLLNHAKAIECRVMSGQLAAAHDLLTRFDAAYRQLKHEAGGLTFDDVSRRLAAEFSQHNPAGLAFRLDAQLDHLLLDEFQDTSLVQWTVLEPLAKGVADGDGSTFFCVGDVKQAIYGWRGGVAEIFDTVTQRLTGLAEQQLNVSYRSSKPVIDTVNAVFAPRPTFDLLPDHEPCFLEWVNGFPEHSTTKVEEPGYACLMAGPAGKGKQESDAAAFAAAAEFLKELFPRLPPHLTVGVLARTNKAVGALVHELRERDLPASEEGGNPLNDSAAVQIILSATQLADHPGDSIALFHVKHSRLGPALDLPREATPDQAAAAAEHIRRALQTRGYGPVVADWAEILAPDCDNRELDRLRQLTTLADEYERIATLRSSEFVRYVELRLVEDPRTARIRVMTVHKAKGLEFDVVVLPQLDEQLVKTPKFVASRENGAEAAVRVCRYRSKSAQRLFPPEIRDAFRQTSDRSLRESLCVFYVALTRAARALYMFVPPSARPTKTYAGLLRQALAPGKPCLPHAVLYECGDPDWHQHVPRHLDEAALETPSLPAADLPRPAGGPRVRGRETRAPSQLKSRRQLSIRDLLPAVDGSALDRGRLLHAWFEKLQWIDDATPPDDALHQAATNLGSDTKLTAACIAEFRDMLAADGIREVLCRAPYLESAGELFASGECRGDEIELRVETERRFDVILDGALVSGSIDRLVLFLQRGQVVAAEVLDFKSDAVFGDTNARIAQLVDQYSGQLDCYARAVAQIYQLPRDAVSTRLVLLATRQAVECRVR